jgi:hypothetical protein
LSGRGRDHPLQSSHHHRALMAARCCCGFEAACQVIWSSSSHSVIIVSAVAQWQSRCVQRHPVQIASLPAVCHGGCQILLLSAQSCTSCTRPHHPVTDFGLFCPVMLHLEGDQSTFSPLLQSVGVLFMLGRDNLTSHHLHFGPGTWASI